MNAEPRLAPPGVLKRALRFVLRLVLIVCLAGTIGWVLNTAAASLEKRDAPAGFGRGMLQGALMPMALPNLLVGIDVSIYSSRNTGVTYKLGYTCGVNVCGAIFFGFFYWRLNRWRRWASNRSQPSPQ